MWLSLFSQYEPARRSDLFRGTYVFVEKGGKHHRACRVLKVTEKQAMLQDIYNMDTFRLYFRQFRLMKPDEIILHEQARNRLLDNSPSDMGAPVTVDLLGSRVIPDSESVVSAEGFGVLPVSLPNDPHVPEITERTLDLGSDLILAKTLTKLNMNLIMRRSSNVTFSEWCQLFAELTGDDIV